MVFQGKGCESYFQAWNVPTSSRGQLPWHMIMLKTWCANMILVMTSNGMICINDTAFDERLGVWLQYMTRYRKYQASLHIYVNEMSVYTCDNRSILCILCIASLWRRGSKCFGQITPIKIEMHRSDWRLAIISFLEQLILLGMSWPCPPFTDLPSKSNMS